jgi:hypothetical protein
MIYLCGARRIRTYDLKMPPAEIRGEFQPIATNVPGIQICEHLPRLARIMDKLVPIRTMYGSPNGSHDSFICYTGRSFVQQPPGGWPSVGSTLSKLLGPKNQAIPPFVGLSPRAGHPPYGSPGHPGFLGPAHSAFRPNGEGQGDLSLNGINADRLNDRRQLLSSVDRIAAASIPAASSMGRMRSRSRRLGVLSSSKLAEALDVSREIRTCAAVRQGDTRNYGDGAPRNLEHFLIARRLVEAGARCVTLNFGRWDFHSNNFSEFKNTHGPLFDQGMSALVEDLHERGLDKDVSVVAWGEFGRTPVINKDAGRDHWPQVGCGLLAGGGLRTGQVIGRTDRLGGAIVDRPVHFGEVLATLYRQLGVNPTQTLRVWPAARNTSSIITPLPELI